MNEQTSFLLKVGSSYYQVYRNMHEGGYWVPVGNGSRAWSSMEDGENGIVASIAEALNVQPADVLVIHR